MERRGLTIVELLAVLAILVVLTAMALPAIWSRLEGARFESAGRQVEAAIIMARAEAQRRGKPLSLVARESGSETGLFVEALPGRGERMGGSGTPVVVISGARLSAQPPTASTSAGAGRIGGETPAPSNLPAAKQSAVLVLGRFMPDGTASAAGPVYLITGTMAAAYTVNRWTGSAAIRPVALTAKDGGAEQTEAPPAVGERAADGGVR